MTRVVMLGGGYVTLHAYSQLVRRLDHRVRSGEIEIVVISADDCHSFHGFTGEVVAGLLPLERTRTPLAEALPLATVVHGRATHVDPVVRTVSFVRHGAGTTEQVGYAELLVGTGGREPLADVPGLAEHGFTLRGVGEFVTAADLSVVDAPGVWSAGDAARVLGPVTGEPVPTDALWAIKAGAHLGAHLARRLRGRPTRPFGYRGLGQAASYGLGRSVAELYGMEFTGGVAWLLRLTFFLRFMPTRRGAAGVARDLTAVLVTGARPPAAPGPFSRAALRTPTLLAVGPPERAAQAGAR